MKRIKWRFTTFENMSQNQGTFSLNLAQCSLTKH
jgi:hypothetical protein